MASSPRSLFLSLVSLLSPGVLVINLAESTFLCKNGGAYTRGAGVKILPYVSMCVQEEHEGAPSVVPYSIMKNLSDSKCGSLGRNFRIMSTARTALNVRAPSYDLMMNRIMHF